MVIMMHLDLPKNAGFALRHAPSEQQQAFLAVIENWPSNVGQSTQSYSAQLKTKIEQMVAVWGGIWLNPEDGHQKLKLQCAQGHLINARPFSLRQGVGARNAILTVSGIRLPRCKHGRPSVRESACQRRTLIPTQNSLGNANRATLGRLRRIRSRWDGGVLSAYAFNSKRNTLQR